MDNKCPHQDGPLGEGSIENGLLRSPWHGWDFCPHGGSSGDFYDGLETFPIKVEGDVIYVGLEEELFSFPHGNKEKLEFNPFNTGLFHFCIQDPDIENLTNKIVEHGGKQRMPIREYYPNEKPYKMVYVEDPFGVVFEIYTHSYELTYSSGAYQD